LLSFDDAVQKMKWAFHVSRRGEKVKVRTEFWRGSIKETFRFVQIDLDEKTILEWIFKQWGDRSWIGLI